jgi:hypothetical protein
MLPAHYLRTNPTRGPAAQLPGVRSDPPLGGVPFAHGGVAAGFLAVHCVSTAAVARHTATGVCGRWTGVAVSLFTTHGAFSDGSIRNLVRCPGVWTIQVDDDDTKQPAPAGVPSRGFGMFDSRLAIAEKSGISLVWTFIWRNRGV